MKVSSEEAGIQSETADVKSPVNKRLSRLDLLIALGTSAILASVLPFAFQWSLVVNPESTIFGGRGHIVSLAFGGCSIAVGFGLSIIWNFTAPIVKSSLAMSHFVLVRRGAVIIAGTLLGYFIVQIIPDQAIAWIAVVWLLFAIPLYSLRAGSKSTQGVTGQPVDQISEFAGITAAISAIPLIVGFLSQQPGISHVSLYMAALSASALASKRLIQNKKTAK